MKTHKTHMGILVVSLLFATLVFGQRNRPYNDRDDYRYRDRNTNQRNGNQYDQRRPNVVYQQQIVVRPPRAPRMHMGRQPSKRHIWMPAEYMWQGGRYVVVPGYWVVPPRNGHRYVSGYWQPTRGGYVWVSGFWTNGRGNQRWY